MPKLQYRHELKYQLNYSEYLALRQRLRVVMPCDAHVGASGRYRIRSLYFDNPEDKELREKLYGLNNREKFRIRYYNDDYSFIRLEKKAKVNGVGRKQTARVTKEQCEALLAGECEWMKESGDPLLTELYCKMKYQGLRPKTVVDYQREPFVFGPGNVRVTLDSDIRTGLAATDLFNQELPTIQTRAGSVVVAEVKFDQFLPDLVRDVVQVGDQQAHAFSKYAVCREFD